MAGPRLSPGRPSNGRRKIPIPARLVLAVCLWATLAPQASAATVADPAMPGPYGFVRAEYDLPKVQAGLGAQTTGVRPAGDLYFPANGMGPFPVLVFLHGNHSTCTSGSEAEAGLILGPSVFSSYDSGYCTSGNPQLDAALEIDESRSYRGYDYLAELLATQGYIVASMDINDITDWGQNGNAPGYMARVEMMSRTFDLIASWNEAAGPNGIGTGLLGRVDMSSVGVMGHSRGGEGVNLFAQYNATRPATAEEAAAYTPPGQTTPTTVPDFGPRYPLKAVFSLAPVDGQGGFRPLFDSESSTAWATALPYCDGDVFDLQGAPVYERNKEIISADGHPAIQFLVGAANHNYFNTIWANDDAQLFDFGDPYCNDPSGTTRLSKAEQRATGVAMIGGFLRRYVGGETQFDPIMRGESMPDSACPEEPTGAGPNCENVIQTSYAAPRPGRKILISPGGTSLPVATPDGDPITFTGFQSATSCKPAAVSIATTTGCGSSPNRSPVQQLSLSWNSVASLQVDLQGASEDISAFRTLNFRGGTNVSSPLNPAGTEPKVEVSLTDAGGLTRTLTSDDYSAALEPAPGTTARKEVLNGVRIPLAAFTGIDLEHVTAIALSFGIATPTGAIEVADVVLQEPSFTPGPEPPTGEDGEDGEDGKDGEDGADGEDGEDGEDGQDGEDGEDGEDGADGEDGEPGPPGNDGQDGQEGAPGSAGPPGPQGPPGDSVAASGAGGGDKLACIARHLPRRHRVPQLIWNTCVVSLTVPGTTASWTLQRAGAPVGSGTVAPTGRRIGIDLSAFASGRYRLAVTSAGRMQRRSVVIR